MVTVTAVWFLHQCGVPVNTIAATEGTATGGRELVRQLTFPADRTALHRAVPSASIRRRGGPGLASREAIDVSGRRWQIPVQDAMDRDREMHVQEDADRIVLVLPAGEAASMTRESARRLSMLLGAVTRGWPGELPAPGAGDVS